MPPGRYIVKVGIAYGLTTYVRSEKSHVYYPETFHPSAGEASKATVVEVATGRETTDIDIAVGRPLKLYEIVGQLVLVENGAPVPNVGTFLHYNGSRLHKSRDLVQGWIRELESEILEIALPTPSLT